MDALRRTNRDARVKIKVVGVGGAGCNAVNRMVQDGLSGIDVLALNTETQSLSTSLADYKLPLGPNVTRGRGAGGDPAVGCKAAEESIEAIKEILSGAEMVFVTAGLGGGTGTGASPLVAAAAREVGALTVAIVTTPFGFEGPRKMTLARQGLQKLAESSDTYIVVPNQKLLEKLPRGVSFKEAFHEADGVLHQGVDGVIRLVMGTAIINVDFNDITTIMRGGGRALMAIGKAGGETRAVDAAMAAIENPLLDSSIDGASRVLMHIKGGSDMSLQEVTEAAGIIHDRMDGEANVIWGAETDESMDGEMEMILIATAFTEDGGRAAALRSPQTGAGGIRARNQFGIALEDLPGPLRPQR